MSLRDQTLKRNGMSGSTRFRVAFPPAYDLSSQDRSVRAPVELNVTLVL